jgi:hypothetical protein
MLAMASVSAWAAAAEFRVGPGRPYATLQALFSGVPLQPGDLVLVDASDYAGGVILDHAGTAAQPITIRGLRGGNGRRPKLSGGTNTFEFRRADHVVLEGFEFTGGSSRCVYVNAANVVLRDLLVQGCVGQGILSSDQYSGSITLEYSEIRTSGGGDSRHALYIQTDEVTHPGSVFRMRFNYVHSGAGGNLLKSRAERNEIHCNWFEGAFYHELELIGPDRFTQLPGWSVDLKREDSEVLGNVIVHSGSFGAVMRLGGDGTGESRGRYRIVNNTIVINGSANPATVFRLFDGIESVEAHNNVIWRSSAGVLRIERNIEAEWAAGVRRVAGSNNWINDDAIEEYRPGEWVDTLTGATTGFVDPAMHDYRSAAGSALLTSGNANPASPASWPFPGPTLLPTHLPPRRQWQPPGSALPRTPQSPPAIGAVIDADPVFGNGFE